MVVYLMLMVTSMYPWIKWGMPIFYPQIDFTCTNMEQYCMISTTACQCYIDQYIKVVWADCIWNRDCMAWWLPGDTTVHCALVDWLLTDVRYMSCTAEYTSTLHARGHWVPYHIPAMRYWPIISGRLSALITIAVPTDALCSTPVSLLYSQYI